MGFPKQEHWSGLPFPSPGHLPNPGIEPASPALAGRFFTSETLGKPTRRERALQNLQPLNSASQPAPLSPKPWERYKKTSSFKRSESWGQGTHVQDEQGLKQHQSKGMAPRGEPRGHQHSLSSCCASSILHLFPEAEQPPSHTAVQPWALLQRKQLKTQRAQQ